MARGPLRSTTSSFPPRHFVIETKNYAGWIFGGEHSRYWTQVIYSKKSRFQNPLYQNAMHVRALAIATGLPRDCFHNLVYFAGDATLKTAPPPKVLTEGLASYIRGHRIAVIPPKDVDGAAAVLKAAGVRSGESEIRRIPSAAMGR